MQLEPERLIKILEVLGELPLPNYRCVGPLRSQSADSPHATLGPPLVSSPLAPRPQPHPCPGHPL